MEERFQAAAKNCDCSIKFFREAKINDVPMKIATIEHSSVASSARFGLEKPQNSFEIGHETFSRPQQQQQATRLGAAKRAATLGTKVGVSVSNTFHYIVSVTVD